MASNFEGTSSSCSVILGARQDNPSHRSIAAMIPSFSSFLFRGLCQRAHHILTRLKTSSKCSAFSYWSLEFEFFQGSEVQPPCHGFLKIDQRPNPVGKNTLSWHRGKKNFASHLCISSCCHIIIPCLILSYPLLEEVHGHRGNHAMTTCNSMHLRVCQRHAHWANQKSVYLSSPFTIKTRHLQMHAVPAQGFWKNYTKSEMA